MRSRSICIQGDEYRDPNIDHLAKYLQKTLIITDQQAAVIDNPSKSLDSERSPTFVVGSTEHMNPNKYITMTNPNDTNDDSSFNSHNTDFPAHQLQRSSSQTDIPVFGVTDRRASLPAERNIFYQNEAQLVKDFPSQLAKYPQSSSVDSIHTPGLTETLPVNSILELWERSQIPKGRDILLELGFENDFINPAQLSNALEEEIPALDEEPQMILMKAWLVLQSTKFPNLRQTSTQQPDENSKRNTNNKDANMRVALFAAETKQRCSSLEDVTKMEIRSLEQQHVGVVRDHTSTGHLDDDCENWSTFKTRFQAHLKTFGMNDIKLTPELELVRKERDDLESDQHQMQKQYTELLEKNSVEHHELSEYDESTHLQQRKKPHDNSINDDEVSHLVKKMSTLQIGSFNIRNQHNELITEREPINRDLNIPKIMSKKSSENVSANINANTVTKRRGDSSIEESLRLSKLRKCTTDEVESRNQDIPEPKLKAKESAEVIDDSSTKKILSKRRGDSSIEEIPRHSKFRKRTNAEMESRTHDLHKPEIKAKKSSTTNVITKRRGDSSIEDSPQLGNNRKWICTEIESLNHEVNNPKFKVEKSAQYIHHNSTANTVMKRKRDSSIEESVGKFSKCISNSYSENSDTTGELVDLHSEFQSIRRKITRQAQVDMGRLLKEIAELEDQLNQNASSSSATDEELLKELQETQNEYEYCAYYWQDKLLEYNSFFEKEIEIYEEEQEESDRMFTNLIEKFRDDEAKGLYADAETEAAEIKESARKIFEEKSDENQVEVEDQDLLSKEDYGILEDANELNTEKMAFDESFKEECSRASYLLDERTVSLDNAYNLSIDSKPLVSLPLVSNQTVR